MIVNLLLFYATSASVVLFAWLGILRLTRITSVGDLLDRLDL